MTLPTPADDRPNLTEIALATGTDKATVHSYTQHYERHLRHLRDRPVRLLEIGVGGYADPLAGGESLRMWKAYFERGQIVGIDIRDKSALAEDRITILQGDQSDPAFLERVGSEYGPFDVIVDDGSHRSAHVIASFVGLFPHLAEHGIYAIEDLQASYWETYGGASGPDRRGTSMAFLQEIVDGLNYAEFDLVGYVPTTFDEQVVAVSFYHNLAFIEKGDNREPSSALPPHPRDRLLVVPQPKARPRPSVRARVARRVRLVVRSIGRRDR